MTTDIDQAGQSDQGSEREYIKGGKGRRDEVGGSGIYPASSPDAPIDAEVRTPGDFVRHRGGRRQPDDASGLDTDETEDRS